MSVDLEQLSPRARKLYFEAREAIEKEIKEAPK